MRVRHSNRPLPKSWIGHPALVGKKYASWNLTPFGKSRLMVKLLVFDSQSEMGDFWHLAFGHPRLKSSCMGCCTCLSERVTEKKGGIQRQWIEVDKHYFAVIALSKNSLCIETIVHESIHAACAFRDRMLGRWKWPGGHVEEEAICYPAGRIAELIVKAVLKEKML